MTRQRQHVEAGQTHEHKHTHVELSSNGLGVISRVRDKRGRDFGVMAGAGTGAPSDDAQQQIQELFLGSGRAEVRGLQYYRGVVSRGEAVSLVREPHNQYDRNAVRVDNILGAQVGHIGREWAAAMAPVMDRMGVRFDATLPQGASGYSCTIELHAFGVWAAAPAVHSSLRVFTPRYVNLAPTTLYPPASWAGSGSGGAAASPVRAQPSPAAAMAAMGATFSDAVVQRHAEELFVGAQPYDAMPEAPQPAALLTRLFPHQAKALAWMIARERPLTVAQALAEQSTGGGGAAVASAAGAGASGAGAAGASASGSGAALGTEAAALAALRSVIAQSVADGKKRAMFWEVRGSSLFNIATNSLVKVADAPPLPRGGILADEVRLPASCGRRLLARTARRAQPREPSSNSSSACAGDAAMLNPSTSPHPPP